MTSALDGMDKGFAPMIFASKLTSPVLMLGTVIIIPKTKYLPPKAKSHI